jgi:hypothetical protein
MAKSNSGAGEWVVIILILIAIPGIYFLLKGFAVILSVVTAIGALLGFGWLWGLS